MDDMREELRDLRLEVDALHMLLTALIQSYAQRWPHDVAGFAQALRSFADGTDLAPGLAARLREWAQAFEPNSRGDPRAASPD